MNLTIGDRLLYTIWDEDYVITDIEDDGSYVLESEVKTWIQSKLQVEHGIKSGEIIKWNMPVVTSSEDIKGSKVLNKTPNFDDYPPMSDSKDPLIVNSSEEPTETNILILLVAIVCLNYLQ